MGDSVTPADTAARAQSARTTQGLMKRCAHKAGSGLLSGRGGSGRAGCPLVAAGTAG